MAIGNEYLDRPVRRVSIRSSGRIRWVLPSGSRSMEIAPDTCITRCWKTEFVGMDWMQDLPIQESRQGAFISIAAGLGGRIC